MDGSAREERLAEILDLLEACLPTETEALPAQTEAHIQEAIEHVLSAQKHPDGRESRDHPVTNTDASATTGSGDDGGDWISADVASTVTLAEWR